MKLLGKRTGRNVLMGGDWNFMCEDEERIQLGKRTYEDKRGYGNDVFFQKTLEHFVEQAQLSHTRMRYMHNQIDVMSRLDRF